MTKKTKERHAAIADVITKEKITDQQTLLDRIKQKHNIDVSQSIISRDLRAMGVGKITKYGKQMYNLPAEDATKTILRFAVLDIIHNENTIVIHTIGGCADFVGDFLDANKKDNIIGTIAGENTIIIIPQSITHIKKIVKNLKILLHVT